MGISQNERGVPPGIRLHARGAALPRPFLRQAACGLAKIRQPLYNGGTVYSARFAEGRANALIILVKDMHIAQKFRRRQLLPALICFLLAAPVPLKAEVSSGLQEQSPGADAGSGIAAPGTQPGLDGMQPLPGPGATGPVQAAAAQKMRVLVVANREATIAGRLYGTISQIHVRESERFKAGQTLVSFDCRELAAEKAVAQAELRLHSTTNKANAELYAEKVIGSLEKDLSQAKVAEANAKIKAVNAKMANCSITAPFDGQVVELKAKAHETLQPGMPIMLIQNSHDLEAHVHVPSAWMVWLKPGARFRAHIEESGTAYEARVTALGARVDPVSRTVKIYAEIPGDHPELLPGMSGYAEFDRQ